MGSTLAAAGRPLDRANGPLPRGRPALWRGTGGCHGPGANRDQGGTNEGLRPATTRAVHGPGGGDARGGGRPDELAPGRRPARVRGPAPGRDHHRAGPDGRPGRGGRPGVTPVSDYMTPAPEVLRPDSDLAEAARQMLQLGVRHLPVVQRGRLVGVLSMRDVLGGGGGRPPAQRGGGDLPDYAGLANGQAV